MKLNFEIQSATGSTTPIFGEKSELYWSIRKGMALFEKNAKDHTLQSLGFEYGNFTIWILTFSELCNGLKIRNSMPVMHR